VRFLVGDRAIENKSKDEILMTREFDSGKFSNLSDAELEPWWRSRARPVRSAWHRSDALARQSCTPPTHRHLTPLEPWLEYVLENVDGRVDE
jgi:hypothetical protein